MRPQQLVDMAAGSVPVKGAPVDPALGLVRTVVYEKRWVQRIEFLLGVFTAALGVYVIAAAVAGTPMQTKYGALIYVCAPAGAGIMWDSWRKLRRWPGLVIAELGFDDRMGDHPSGPVLWREVEAMHSGKSWHVSTHGAAGLPSFVVELLPGPRPPLSPLGSQPKQIKAVTLELATGPEKRIPELMEAAYQSWLERERLYAGFDAAGIGDSHGSDATIPEAWRGRFLADAPDGFETE
jgi:hypothetical protein